jgi:selenophosphate synthetase-related protein
MVLTGTDALNNNRTVHLKLLLTVDLMKQAEFLSCAIQQQAKKSGTELVGYQQVDDLLKNCCSVAIVTPCNGDFVITTTTTQELADERRT